MAYPAGEAEHQHRLQHTTQIIALGGAYTFGPNTVGLAFSRTTDKLVVNDRQGVKATANIAELNFKSRLTPVLLVGIAYTYTMGNITATGHESAKVRGHQISLGGQYDLSKRTSLYLTGSAQSTKIGTERRSALNSCGPTQKPVQMGVRAGLLHRF